MRDVVIFDIDGTLANVNHRVHHVTSDIKEERDWRAFYDEMHNDTPFDNICQLARIFHEKGLKIWAVTGRAEDHRQFTEQWLIWNEIPFDELRMRPKDDMRKDFECKADLLKPEEESRVLAIFEDRQTVVDMWRSRGLTVCQVDAGEY